MISWQVAGAPKGADGKSVLIALWFVIVALSCRGLWGILVPSVFGKYTSVELLIFNISDWCGLRNRNDLGCDGVSSVLSNWNKQVRYVQINKWAKLGKKNLYCKISQFKYSIQTRNPSNRLTKMRVVTLLWRSLWILWKNINKLVGVFVFVFIKCIYWDSVYLI